MITIYKEPQRGYTITNVDSPVSLPPSLRDLLQQASVSEYIIRTGCQMFSGVDERERMKQVEQEWAKLREVVNTLQTILNK